MRYGDKYALVLLIIMGAVYTAYKYRHPVSAPPPEDAPLTPLEAPLTAPAVAGAGSPGATPLPVTALPDPEHAPKAPDPPADAKKPPVVSKLPTVQQAAKGTDAKPHPDTSERTAPGADALGDAVKPDGKTADGATGLAESLAAKPEKAAPNKARTDKPGKKKPEGKESPPKASAAPASADHHFASPSAMADASTKPTTAPADRKPSAHRLPPPIAPGAAAPVPLLAEHYERRLAPLGGADPPPTAPAVAARPKGTKGKKEGGSTAQLPRRHRVADGDTLPKLAARYLGDSRRHPEIFAANPDVLSDPRLLPVGIDLVIPDNNGKDREAAAKVTAPDRTALAPGGAERRAAKQEQSAVARNQPAATPLPGENAAPTWPDEPADSSPYRPSASAPAADPGLAPIPRNALPPPPSGGAERY